MPLSWQTAISPGSGHSRSRSSDGRMGSVAAAELPNPPAPAREDRPARGHSTRLAQTAAAAGSSPRQRCERRDDRIGILQQHDVAAAVGGSLDGVVDVGHQSAATADHRNSGRQVERQRARTIDRPVVAVLALEHRIFHSHDGRRGKPVIGCLVAPTELGGAAEQVALDHVVGRARGAAFRAGRPPAPLDELVVRQAVLVGIPIGREEGDQRDEDAPLRRAARSGSD